MSEQRDQCGDVIERKLLHDFARIAEQFDDLERRSFRGPRLFGVPEKVISDFLLWPPELSKNALRGGQFCIHGGKSGIRCMLQPGAPKLRHFFAAACAGGGLAQGRQGWAVSEAEEVQLTLGFAVGGAPFPNDILPHGQDFAHAAHIADVVSSVIHVEQTDGKADGGKHVIQRVEILRRKGREGRDDGCGGPPHEQTGTGPAGCGGEPPRFHRQQTRSGKLGAAMVEQVVEPTAQRAKPVAVGAEHTGFYAAQVTQCCLLVG